MFVQCDTENLFTLSTDTRIRIYIAKMTVVSPLNVILLWGFLIPIINPTFIEQSMAAYLVISFFLHVILRLDLVYYIARAFQPKPPPKAVSLGKEV